MCAMPGLGLLRLCARLAPNYAQDLSYWLGGVLAVRAAGLQLLAGRHGSVSGPCLGLPRADCRCLHQRGHRTFLKLCSGDNVEQICPLKRSLVHSDCATSCTQNLVRTSSAPHSAGAGSICRLQAPDAILVHHHNHPACTTCWLWQSPAHDAAAAAAAVLCAVTAESVGVQPHAWQCIQSAHLCRRLCGGLASWALMRTITCSLYMRAQATLSTAWPPPRRADSLQHGQLNCNDSCGICLMPRPARQPCLTHTQRQA